MQNSFTYPERLILIKYFKRYFQLLLKSWKQNIYILICLGFFFSQNLNNTADGSII